MHSQGKPNLFLGNWCVNNKLVPYGRLVLCKRFEGCNIVAEQPRHCQARRQLMTLESLSMLQCTRAITFFDIRSGKAVFRRQGKRNRKAIWTRMAVLMIRRFMNERQRANQQYTQMFSVCLLTFQKAGLNQLVMKKQKVYNK